METSQTIFLANPVHLEVLWRGGPSTNFRGHGSVYNKVHLHLLSVGPFSSQSHGVPRTELELFVLRG